MKRPIFHTACARDRGFTLIELVIVITIIGILAAVALPRLIDAQRDARIAKANAIYGSIRSATALARSRCELDFSGVAPSPGNNCASTPSVVNMDGYTVYMLNRHPKATVDGIDVAAQINLASDGLTAGSATLTNVAGQTVNARTFDVVGGTSPNCRISYGEAALNGNVIVAPVITVTTTGC